MNANLQQIANAIKTADVDNASRKAMGEAMFNQFGNSRTKLVDFLGACGVTRTTRNILNPEAGEFEIPINTPYFCDPGSETYHCM
jgi:hypothetical protein